MHRQGPGRSGQSKNDTMKEVSMNWDQIEGNWKQLKGRVQQQWGKLTDDDFDKINGKRVELVGKVQAKYGYAREEAEAEVEKFCNTCHNKS
jgi:uncharacterized protein YjbJ (UPF0337 family)